ncbi:MAG: integral rane protein [Frankiales bacterium]|nr:integral rane protein [Frankiales bacterium]
MTEPRGWLAWRRLPWPAEILSIGIGYVFYSFIRVLAPDRIGASYQHAWELESIEKQLGLFPELGLNGFLSRHEVLQDIASYYYASLHFIVTPVVLVWLWKRRAQFYSPLRSSLVIASLSALVVYATFPVAPPRFALPGTVDSVALHPVLWESGHGVEGLVNELAAMPSLHVGWALWCAVAIVLGCRSRWRHLAWLYPIGTALVVVATANHYILDAAAGALIVLAPMALCFRWTRSTSSYTTTQVSEAVSA